MRKTVTAAVKKAKNDWFQQKAKDIEDNQNGVVGDAWKYIRDIQRGKAGLQLMKSKAIRNLNGDLCSISFRELAEMATTVLNTAGVFSLDL